MCTTCGCGHPDQVRIGELPHVHHDSNAQHATKLPNFSHSPPSHARHAATRRNATTITESRARYSRRKQSISRYESSFLRISIFWQILFQVQDQAKQPC